MGQDQPSNEGHAQSQHRRAYRNGLKTVGNNEIYWLWAACQGRGYALGSPSICYTLLLRGETFAWGETGGVGEPQGWKEVGGGVVAGPGAPMSVQTAGTVAMARDLSLPGSSETPCRASSVLGSWTRFQLRGESGGLCLERLMRGSSHPISSFSWNRPFLEAVPVCETHSPPCPPEKVRQCPLVPLCLFQGRGLSCWPEEGFC